MRLGDLHKAELAFSESLNRTRELAACDPDETAHIVAQAAILNKLALITGLRGRLKQADAIFSEPNVYCNLALMSWPLQKDVSIMRLHTDWWHHMQHGLELMNQVQTRAQVDLASTKTASDRTQARDRQCQCRASRSHRRFNQINQRTP